MKDSKDITILLLTITAVILGAMLISSLNLQNTAYAGNTSVRQGDYIMHINRISDSTDLLLITDIATRRMNVYEPNLSSRSIDLLDQVNLERAFGR